MTTANPSIPLAHLWAAAAAGDPGSLPPRITCLRQGWGAMQLGESILGTPLCLHGRTFASGLGTHADSEIHLGGHLALRRFRAEVGVDENRDTRGQTQARVVFAVHLGGRELWRSPVLGVADEPVTVDLALPAGTRDLVLLATSPDGNIMFAHADWADIVLEQVDGTVLTVGKTLVPTSPPVSFRIDGRAADFSGWTRHATAPAEQDGPGPEGLHTRRVTWRDPVTALEIRLDLRTSAVFPTVEWLLTLRNGGRNDSPLIEDIQALDAQWIAGHEPHLHRAVGSPCRIDDFIPHDLALPLGACERLGGAGGRSSSAWLPFFNVQTASNGPAPHGQAPQAQTGNTGVIAAVGWTGQWSAGITHRDDHRIQVRVGLERTHLRLHAGEEIRLPRILLLFWQGRRDDAQNQLRRYILAHHTPHPGGKRLEGPLTVAHWGGMKTSEHLARLAVYKKAGMTYDYYWIDAGWYGPADSYSPDEFTGDWARHVGDWNVNPKAHPHGLKIISDAAWEAGMRFLLWFEPERAIFGTPLTREHPEWFLGDHVDGRTVLFDLGNPEARAWLTTFVGDAIAQHGVHLYRQDFNMDPLGFWRAADAPDRQGMHEIRHIEGLYAFWDALRARFPDLVIDNCASGGRRIDLETTSRSIPLWRSDFQCVWTADPIGGQAQTMGLAQWVPLSGTGVIGGSRRAGDTYNFRSALSPALQFAIWPYESFPIDPAYPWDWHRRMQRDYERTRPLFHGDYHPLGPVNTTNHEWAMYQMHRPDLGAGFVCAFRRPGCPYSVGDIALEALDPAAVYACEDADSGSRVRISGEDLRTKGLHLEFPAAPASRLVFYQKVTP